MKFGYVRVSSKDQNVARQVEALKGRVNEENILIDKVSGKDTNRPELQVLLGEHTLRSGDELFIKSIDRLARNTKDLLEIVDKLISKGVTVRFIDNDMAFDNTPASRLIRHCCKVSDEAAFCLIQRPYISKTLL
ncbi:recombinase family protein, partial [Enterobacter hormaechei]|uniref:recombinase family protein n=1 Tax=Enterobacter hormaechei TaxID=158836 RepID=UPI000AD38E65